MVGAGARPGARLADGPYNGFVDDDRRVLYASGTPDEVATFLRDVAAALTALPVDRLPVERRLLRTEAAQRDEPGVVPWLLSHRYGAAGYGLSVYEEIGLRWLGTDEVAAWAAERFTLENAVLLELRALPGELGVGELPLALVAAQYGLVIGLLAITDGRFLWLRQRSDGLQRIAWRWASLAEVEARSVGELRVTPREGGTESFTVKPVGRAREIADLIGGQIAAADV
jgi:hypothetical protein